MMVQPPHAEPRGEDWRQESVEIAKTWDMSYRENRVELRRRQRRLFDYRYGIIFAVAGGILGGGLMSFLAFVLLGGFQ